MCRLARCTVLVCAVLGSMVGLPAGAASYNLAAQQAATWILAHENPDGSWGATDDVQYLDTSEVVLGLRANNDLAPGYYGAITWLENHFPENADYRARRVLALSAIGDSVSEDLSYLASDDYSLPSDSSDSGFGLSPAYLASPLDTALALEAYQASGETAESQGVVPYLESVQLTGSDPGWAVGEETVADPATTAHVLLALIGYRASDSTVATPIANGLAALNADVTTSSPPDQIALAVLANLRNSGSSSQAQTFANALISTQESDGSWNEDPYATSLALRALSTYLGLNAGSDDQAVEIDDPNLRAAINQALGHSALDAVNQGELGQLTTLNIAGDGIIDLNGLQYATNLTYLNASNNDITSWAPVSGLTNATIVQTGNPGYPAPTDDVSGDAPTLPEWGVILLGALLLAIAQSRTHRAAFVSSGRKGRSRS